MDSLCELAASKDGGFRREHLAGALAHFDKITPTMFDAYTDDYEALRHRIAAARNSLQASTREGPFPKQLAMKPKPPSEATNVTNQTERPHPQIGTPGRRVGREANHASHSVRRVGSSVGCARPPATEHAPPFSSRPRVGCLVTELGIHPAAAVGFIVVLPGQNRPLTCGFIPPPKR